jgi:hypothetical protein
MKMKEFKFTDYPSNSSVSSGVTLLVSAWFAVAAGAILADPVSPYTQRALAEANQPTRYVEEVATPASVAIAPEAHFTITVEASRSATL